MALSEHNRHRAWRSAWIGLVLLLVPVAVQAQSRLYAGLNKSRGYVVGSALSQSGLHRFDGDTTWTHLGWNNPRISGIAFHPTDPNTIFLAAGNGAMVSRDNGRSWRIATGWEVTEVQDIVAEADGRVYLGMAYGVWRSEDNGETFVESSEGIPFMKRYTQDIEVDRTQPGRVFAATDGGVYVSEDGARSWQLTSPVVTVMDVTQSATNPDLWLAATRGQGVLRSDDGGRTWRSASNRFNRASIIGVAIDPTNGQRMAAGGWDTGVWISTNGGRSWTQRTRGLPSRHIYALIYDENTPGRLWAATVEEGIYTSDDDGRSWRYAGMNGTLVFDFVFRPEQP